MHIIKGNGIMKVWESLKIELLHLWRKTGLLEIEAASFDLYVIIVLKLSPGLEVRAVFLFKTCHLAWCYIRSPASRRLSAVPQAKQQWLRAEPTVPDCFSTPRVLAWLLESGLLLWMLLCQTSVRLFYLSGRILCFICYRVVLSVCLICFGYRNPI